MTSYTTGTAHAADEEGLIALTRATGMGYATRETFSHWFSKHPHGLVRVAVVRTQDEIVGACWIFPLRTTYRGRAYELAHVGNLLVRPDHQGGFAYALLARRVNTEAAHVAPVHASFVTERTRARYAEDDAGGVATWPWHVRVLDPDAWAEAYAERRGKQPGLQAVARSVARFLSPALPPLPNGYRIVDASDASEWLDAPLSLDPERVTVVTDRAFFRWRFGSGTAREYTYVGVAGPSGERGVAVLRIDRWEKGRTAVLCHSDATSDEAHAALVTAIILRSADEGASTLEALAPSRRAWAQGFRAAGLLPNPGRRWRRLEGLWPAPQPVLVNTHDPSHVPAEISAAAKWAPTLLLHETY